MTVRWEGTITQDLGMIFHKIMQNSRFTLPPTIMEVENDPIVKEEE